MLTEHPYGLRYLLTALNSAPTLLERLLEGLTPAEADFQPDPKRFAIREIMAHLAEWEPIFLERMRRICAEEHPTLPDLDEGDLALQHHYATSDFAEQLQLFGERRAELVEFLRSRPAADWQRTANRPEIGVVTLESLAVLIPLHDTYHLAQITQWRQLHNGATASS